METRQTSLRWVIEKWLAPGARVHITRVNPSKTYPWRCVRVELTSRSGDLAIVFFRHEDGSWRAFPVERKRPAMNLECVPRALTINIGAHMQQIA